MRLRIRFQFATAFLLLTFCFTAVAQGSHTLQGRVITPSGLQPQNPVRVTLTFNGRQIYETFTDLSGRFSFTGLVKGTYQLIAEGDDQTFDRTTVYAEVSAFGSAPQLFTQDIQLRPITKGSAGRAGVLNAFTQSVPKEAAQAFERAKTLEAHGKSEDAVPAYEEALRIFPSYFEAHLALGNLLSKKGNFNQAIAELDRAREINPNDERLYQSFGLILMQQHNYPVAVAVFSEAGRLNPQNPINALMRATALIYQAAATSGSAQSPVAERKALVAKADQAVSQAATLSNGRVKLDHLTASLFYELKGESEKSARELEEYLRLTPTSANAPEIREKIRKLREAQRSP